MIDLLSVTSMVDFVSRIKVLAWLSRTHNTKKKKRDKVTYMKTIIPNHPTLTTRKGRKIESIYSHAFPCKATLIDQGIKFSFPFLYNIYMAFKCGFLNAKEC
jgi:hypothetical protein